MYCYYVTAVNLPLCYHVTVTVQPCITCNSSYSQSNITRQGNVTGFRSFVCDLLARSQYASGHLDTRFLESSSEGLDSCHHSNLLLHVLKHYQN